MAIELLAGVANTGKTYTAELYPVGSGTIEGSALTMSELGAIGRYYVDTPGLAAGAYTVIFKESGTVQSVSAPTYYWDGTQEVTPLELSTLSSADLAATQAAIISQGDTAWATATGFNTVVPDNTTIGTLATRLTDARALKLDTVATTANAASFQATGFATPANVTAAQTAIINQGDSAWVTATGFNTVAPDNATLSTLATDFTALLTVSKDSFTADALQLAPTGSGGSGGLTTNQADQLADLAALVASGAFTSAALVNTPTVDVSGLATATSLASAQTVIDSLLALETADETKTGNVWTKADRVNAATLLTKTVTENGEDYTIIG